MVNERPEDETQPDALSVLPDGIAEEVVRAIESSGHIPKGRLEVLTSDGAVKLRGQVPSYYQKQVAQTLALTVIKPRRLVNEIEVACVPPS